MTAGQDQGGPVSMLVTAGTFSLDGGTWEVENNVWLIGDAHEVLVIDPAHDLEAITAAIGARRVVAFVCTHAHDDHVNQAPALADRFGAPILLNPDELALWKMTHPDREPDGEISHGQVLSAGGVDLKALVTPGHSPGSTSFHAPDLDALFSGDTLFQGGPGATGRSFASFETIIDSIRDTLLVLPGHTRVWPGHGSFTTVSTEAPHLEEWIARGY